eukprot:TRINITY_DN8124_c0_g1_i2.p1 TRINITY_DN8124_c0_g1~~TRINITY_DN8124_c0_g1_i2.p1  ORF type:complete len:478 (-),score=123.75 TRINITY_DN8124_c0_g1_i2:3-1436(-)
MASVISQNYDLLCNMVIRPPRLMYELHDLGPKQFSLQGKRFLRTDFQLVNARGLTVHCSHFEPFDDQYNEGWKLLPCVIYCHGNGGGRLDALEAVRTLLPNNITVLALDFAGSGLSEGEYVSLGYFEKDDVAVAVNYLRETGRVSTIGLWGRSMGAVTALLYARDDPTIAGMVLDSPFSSLSKVAEELVTSVQQKIPKFVVSLGLKVIRGSIKKKARFDIKALDVVSQVHQCFIPALFVHARDDNFVRPHHSECLHEKYGGDKNRILIDGDHNSVRPEFFTDSVIIFFNNTLGGPTKGEGLSRRPSLAAASATNNVGPASFSASAGQDQVDDTEEEIMRRAKCVAFGNTDRIQQGQLESVFGGSFTASPNNKSSYAPTPRSGPDAPMSLMDMLHESPSQSMENLFPPMFGLDGGEEDDDLQLALYLSSLDAANKEAGEAKGEKEKEKKDTKPQKRVEKKDKSSSKTSLKSSKDDVNK